MSSLVTCRELGKAYGAQSLFTGLNLSVSSGDRIGLIGPNGSGKSTLLKIICGFEDEDSGAVVRRKNLLVSYLAQQDNLDESLSSEDNLMASLAESPLAAADKRGRVQAMLSRAHLADPGAAVATLSGGWRKRVSICAALVKEPDLLVMDEPTNHLDIEGIVWLERMISSSGQGSPSALMMVSHDRRFLENCVNRVVELSRVYPAGTFESVGSYSRFLEQRQEFLARQNQLEERLANKVRRETEWLRRGPKARTTKARYRIDEAYRLQQELGTVKSLNRAEGRVNMEFTATGRKTKKLLEAKGLSKRFDDKLLFADLDLVLAPGTRLGLVGRNGCGKSTLMSILALAGEGHCGSDSGSIGLADGVSISTFTQDRSSLDLSLSLRRALAPDGDGVVFQGRSVHVVSWAKRFLFRPDQLETPVAQLSGGEQARILIADLMRRPADILLLDEPTNDLDIGSLDVLEESLQEFGGAIVLVTHDRYLLDRVCDQVIGFLGDGTVYLYSDCDQWLRDLEEEDGANGTGAAAAGKGRSSQAQSQASRSKKSGRLSYLDQREYDQIEEQIMTAEARCEELEASLGEPETAGDPEALHRCWEELEQARSLVERLYQRWDELEEKKNRGE